MVIERNANRHESKTDDAMIVVMRAYNDLGPRELGGSVMAQNRFGSHLRRSSSA